MTDDVQHVFAGGYAVTHPRTHRTSVSSEARGMSALDALIRNERERGRCGYGCAKCAAAYLDAQESGAEE